MSTLTFLKTCLALIVTLGCARQIPSPPNSPRLNASAEKPTCPTLTPLPSNAPEPVAPPSCEPTVPAPCEPTAPATSVAETAHPAVTLVATGGYWETQGAHGLYRIVVVTHCGEHCVEDVILEQIDESGSELTVHQAVAVKETAAGRVQAVEFWPSGKWTGELEFLLSDDRGQRSRMCLRILTPENRKASKGACPR
jgi:hypothetical protein